MVAPPIGLERMLRIYFLQQWFNLSEPAVEESLYESVSMREFVGIDLGLEPVPDETTVCKFRHLLERLDFGRLLFVDVGRHLQSKGMKVSGGTIVDATVMRHRPRPKMPVVNAIRKCIRLGRAISGTSA